MNLIHEKSWMGTTAEQKQVVRKNVILVVLLQMNNI